MNFDLYVPINRSGPTHLANPDGDTTGILCGGGRWRYSTFTVMGIVPAGSATCGECNRKAKKLTQAAGERA